METEETKLVSVRGLADRLKLSAVWLKAEAEAGRIPYLRAGRRLLFNTDAVERALLERAAGLNQEGSSDAEQPPERTIE